MANVPDLNAAVDQAVDPLRLMQRVTDRTLDLIDVATGVMVGLADESGVTYVCGAGHRVSALGTRVKLDASLSGVAVRTGQIQRADDVELDPRVDLEACRRLDVASLVCIPLTWVQQTIGVLAVNASTPNAFTDEHVALLTQLGDFLGVAIASACDIFRVSAELFELDGGPVDPDDDGRRPGSDAASRYVVSVLSSDAGVRLDSAHRIQQVLDDPLAMVMAYQPIVDLGTGTVDAIEALARFKVLPDRAPNHWFAEAHRCGLGIDLERLAIVRALAAIDVLPDSVAVTINAGPEAILSHGFISLFSEKTSPRVILEVTEHAAVDDYGALIATLRALRRRGMRIAIDDTGAGYSSLAHILKLAPDFIKLDLELTSGIDIDPVRRALASSLVAFAADTGAHIIAEGVETPDELEVLRDLGIRYGQGFHLGHPGSLADFLRTAAQRKPTGHPTP